MKQLFIYFNSEAATGGVLAVGCSCIVRRVRMEGRGGIACAGVSVFSRVAGLRPVTLLIGGLRCGYFPVGFVGFLEAPFLQRTSRRLLLLIPLSYLFLTLLYLS